jgi:predicted amidohydrolase/N-acetylneuraminic acid mutarotase
MASVVVCLCLSRAVGEPPSLTAARDTNQLKLAWEDANAKLQEALTVDGPWRTVNTAAVNSCQMPMKRAGQFFRLATPPPGKKWLTVAAVNMHSVPSTETNLATMFSYMDEAARLGADLVVFPEAALQQCPPWAEYARKPTDAEMAYMRDTAETVPGPGTDRFVAKAKALSLHVVVGMTEKDAAGRIYNASVFLGPQGVIGSHHKSTPVGNDGLIWSKGTNLIEVFDSPLGKVGLLICAETGGESGSERTLPGARLAAAGADLIATASAWWTGAAGLWDLATCTNALRAARWHVIAEQTGRIGYASCYGHSRIVDPLGIVIRDSGANEGLILSTTDIPIDIPAGAWTQGKDMPTIASTSASCVLDDVLYVMGGNEDQAGSPALRAVWAYSAKTDSWSRKADLPAARHFLGQCAATVEGKIYLVGGSGPGIPGPLVRPVAIYDPQADSWTHGAPMPTGRGNLAACAVDGIIYAIAGTTGPSSQLATVEAYDPKTDTWTRKASMPKARWFVTASVVNGIIYVFSETDVFAYNPRADQWTTKTSHFSPYSWGLMSAAVDGIIYVFGGFSQDWKDGHDFTWAYDPARDEFTPGRKMPRKRAVAACGAIAGKIYITGGVSKEPIVNPNAVFYHELDILHVR